MAEAELKIVRCGTELEGEIFQFCLKHFFPDEPLNASLNRIPSGKDSFGPIRDIGQGYSFVAYAEGDNGQDVMVGVVINKITRRNQADKNKPEDPVSLKIYNILHEIGRRADVWSRIPCDEAMYTVILATNTEYRKLGIGRKLLEKTLEMARAQGHSHAVIECTSHYSSRLAEMLGYQMIAEIRYDEYKDDSGRSVFSPGEPHEALRKYLRVLT